MKYTKRLSIVCTSILVLGLVFETSANGGGSVSGKVVFEGDPPKQRKLKTQADPACHEMHVEEPLLSETVIVNENGTLRNVFVYVKSGLEGHTFEKPSDPVILDQKGCQYHPHVFGMMTKQQLQILNSDDTAHNVHAVPTVNQEFNIGQPQKNMVKKTTFKEPEIMVKFKCDVHSWMTAYCGVLDHPFFAVTGEDGSYLLKGLPSGTYEVEAWHEEYGTQSQSVTIGDGDSKELDFKFVKSE